MEAELFCLVRVRIYAACGFFFLMTRRPRGSTLFPTTPLFRSRGLVIAGIWRDRGRRGEIEAEAIGRQSAAATAGGAEQGRYKSCLESRDSLSPVENVDVDRKNVV